MTNKNDVYKFGSEPVARTKPSKIYLKQLENIHTDRRHYVSNTKDPKPFR